MIENLKPYPETKASGLPWLGDVPSHWDVSTLGGLAQVKSVANQSELQLLSVYLQHGVVRFSDVHEKRTNTTSEDLSKYQAVDPGDFVLNNQQAWRGSVGVSGYMGIISPAYLVLKLSKRYLPAYANLLFRDQCMVSQYLVCSKGVGSIQRNLYWPHLKRVGVVIPLPEEQAAIARFLAWATNRLDRAIGAKRRIIALLQEQKQAIIHRAVTQGLDPSVPLKDSGIPWLGEIPDHWEVLALKRVLSRLVDCEHKTAPFVRQSDYRVVRTTAVRNGLLRWSGTYCTSAKTFTEWTQRAVPEAGDVIFTREAPAGEACIIPEGAKVCLGQRTVLMKPQREIYDSQFLVHMIYTGPPRHLIELTCQGSTVSHFNMDDIGWMKVLAPPLSEQIEIVAKVTELTEAPSLAIEKTEREIDLLREYRTRLIDDVVTGKVDVREAAKGLPEDVEPPIQSDAAGYDGDEAEDDSDSDPIDTEED
jgi:type I restriction enzyme S subunit